MLFGTCTFAVAQDHIFVAYLKDKQQTKYDISEPDEFLSKDAIKRRKNLGIEITEKDLPVSNIYIDSIKNSGAKIISTSKWLNTILFKYDSLKIADIHTFPFIDSLEFIKKFVHDEKDTIEVAVDQYTETDDYYGEAQAIHSFHNALPLFKKGYTGKGVRIAVIDGGFINVDSLSAYAHLFDEKSWHQAYDVTEYNDHPYGGDSHGTKVLSFMAAKTPYTYVGAAPDADYLLIRSEVANYENRIEEFHWARAAELADSLGADIINSSLGYFHFDDSTQNYHQSMLGKQISVVSKVASIAQQTGMVVITSAGNEGEKDWERITFPADAQNAITVGAVEDDSTAAYFTSKGMFVNGKPKPELSAWGRSVSFIRSDGTIGTGSGTSYATPLISGYFACLMEAFPRKSPNEITQALIRSSHLFLAPDSINGYGIPNIELAYLYLKGKKEAEYVKMKLYPNPINNHFVFELHSPTSDSLLLQLFDTNGQTVGEWRMKPNTAFQTRYLLDVNLASGSYFLTARYKSTQKTFKLVRK